MLVSVSAWALTPAMIGAVSHAGCNCLSDVVSNTELEFDVNNQQSYPLSGNQWFSLIKSPASGASQSDYILYRSGASFVDASPNYWEFNGTDQVFFSSANTTFLNNLGKTTGGNDFTIIVVGKSAGGEGKAIVSTQGINSSTRGVAAMYNVDEKFELQQYGDTAYIDHPHRTVFAGGQDFIAVYSYDHDTSQARVWSNGDLSQNNMVMNATTTNPTSALHVGGHTAGAFLPSGFRITNIAFRNVFTSESEERTIRQYYERKYGLDLTDETPESFNFSDVTDQSVSSVISSNILQVSGFSGPASVSISGDGSPSYRVCEDSSCATVLTDWTSSASTIQYGSGQYFQQRHTSSSSNSTTTTSTLSVGGVSDSWNVTTQAAAASSFGDVVASTVFDLDATISASYTGSGTNFANIESTPADGAAQGDYNFTISGATFTGSAGSQSAYFSLDGNDYFYITGGNTTFINNLHKTTGGSDFWLLFSFYLPDDATTDWLFADYSTGPGLRSFINTTQSLGFRQQGGVSSQTNATATVSEATPVTLIISHSHSTNETKYWISTTTGEAVAHTFNTTTGNAQSAFAVGYNYTSYMQNGARFYTIAGGNEYLDNTKAAALFSHIETRHGRDYTP